MESLIVGHQYETKNTLISPLPVLLPTEVNIRLKETELVLAAGLSNPFKPLPNHNWVKIVSGVM